MRVAVTEAAGECLAAIVRHVAADVAGVHGIGVLGIRCETAEVPRALPQVAIGVHEVPGGTRVLRPIDAARIRLDQRPDAARVHGRYGDPDVAPDSARESRRPGDLGPVIAAIGRLPEAAPCAAADEKPRLAPRLPEAGVEHVRVRRVHRQVGGTGRVVAEQDLLPRLAAVLRAIDAAFRIRPEHVAECGDIGDVRIGGVGDDPTDVLRGGESQVTPRLAGIHRLPHAIAVRHVAANRRLAAARPHDVRVALEECHGADRAAEVIVGHRIPRLPAIGRLPHAAACGRDVILIRALGGSHHRGHSSGVRRADEVPVDPLPDRRVDRAGRLHGGRSADLCASRKWRERRSQETETDDSSVSGHRNL